jgi:UDP:flavonoid glycosyltransferase YjiC (YdhE family)
MSRILYAWEIGDHNGHVVPYLPLLQALRAQGHEVVVAARDTGEVGGRVRDAGLGLAQAPTCMRTFDGIDADSIDYAGILQHHGYAHEATLLGLALAWRTLFEALRPDLVIANNAPLALWTASHRRIARIRLGSGFNCPPLEAPMPELRPGTGDTAARRGEADARVVRTVNAVASALGEARIEHVRDLFAGCKTWLFTLPELDHYGERPGAPYLGLPAFTPARVDATVPGAPQVFAYVRMDHPHTEQLLAALVKLDRPALVHCPDIDEARLARYSTARVRISRDPVDAREALAQARVVVNHAGHNLTAEALLSGVPVLALPGHLEQDLVALNVERIALGIRIPFSQRHPKLLAALSRLIAEPDFRVRALGFAAARRPSSPEDFLETLCNECLQRKAA